MLTIAIIGTAGLPANYGGFETLAENLVEELGSDFLFTVYCSSVNRSDRPKKYKNANLVYIPFKANGVSSIPYDMVSMIHALRSSDVMLILGVSGCFLLPVVKLFSRGKIIVHIDGLEWQRAKWRRAVRWFLRASESLAVKYAHIVIADNIALQKYIKNRYQADSVCIEYGGDQAVPNETERLKLANSEYQEIRSSRFSGGAYAIKICRIEPENNVHLVLEVFSKASNLSLIVVGNWSYSAYGNSLRTKYGNNLNIMLMDPIYDKGKLFSLRSNASLYVHGHSAGGTNPSLVEAMYLGLPIVAFDVQYNRETTKNKALYFSDEEHLAEVVDGQDKLDLAALRISMRNIAKKYYTWKRISRLYAKQFYDDRA